MTIVLFSCKPEQNAAPAEVSSEIENPQTKEIPENQFSQQKPARQNYIDSKYEYTDENGKLVIVENSYPKGGQWYTNPKGERYIYAIFWTRISNKTSDSIELTMEFIEESYQLPSSPDIIFKLLIPLDTMTFDKETLTNYGLDLNRYLDSYSDTHVPLKRMIRPKDSGGFYVVTLFNKGVAGTLRTGLTIEKDKLLYRVNDKIINCGKINLKLKK